MAPRSRHARAAAAAAALVALAAAAAPAARADEGVILYADSAAALEAAIVAANRAAPARHTIRLTADAAGMSREMGTVGDANFAVVGLCEPACAVTPAAAGARFITVSGGEVRLSGVSLDGFSTTRDGGALLVKGGEVTLVNVALTGNSAGKGGGAISVRSGAVVQLGFVTFAGNTAEQEGADVLAAGGPELVNLGGNVFGGDATVAPAGAVPADPTEPITSPPPPPTPAPPPSPPPPLTYPPPGAKTKLRLISLADVPGAVCSDGSAAAFYTDAWKPEPDATWVIHLQGGGGCGSDSLCADRLARDDAAAFSRGPDAAGADAAKYWPEEMDGVGLLSADAALNPALHDALHVYLPYCSNDLWTGRGATHVLGATITPDRPGYAHVNETLHSAGQIIADAAIALLMQEYALGEAREVLLSGSEAGGVGAAQLAGRLPDLGWRTMPWGAAADVRLVLDSCFFPDFKDFGQLSANLTERDRFGSILQYHGGMPSSDACLATYGVPEAYMCYRCEVIARHINIPVLALSSRFDAYIVGSGKMGTTDVGELFAEPQVKHIEFLEEYGAAMLETLRLAAEQVLSAVTVINPACFAATYLVASDRDAVVDDETFPEAYRAYTGRDKLTRVTVSGARPTTLYNAVAAWWTGAAGKNSTLFPMENPMEFFDTCDSLKCNPTCPLQLSQAKEEVLVPTDGAEWATIIFSGVWLVGLWAAFFIFVARHAARASRSKSVWAQAEETDGIPSKRSKGGETPTLSTSFLEYEVTARSGERLRLLKDVAVRFGPSKKAQTQGRGSLVAIMGPSGCGKSTLLEVMLGLKKTGNLNGLMHVGTEPHARAQAKLLKNVGYLEQFDSLPADLTVRETLLYKAMLMLPGRPLDELLAKCEQCIDTVDLRSVAGNLVGSGSGTGGLSGGQKRRLSVAVQLLTEPAYLFMDEPTSGLDSSSSLKLLDRLERLTRQGMTIVLTIHQPRPEVFSIFDRVIVMVKGAIVFDSSPVIAVGHFLGLASEMPGVSAIEGANPADLLLDVVSSVEGEAVDLLVSKNEPSKLHEQNLAVAKVAGRQAAAGAQAAPAGPAGVALFFGVVEALVGRMLARRLNSPRALYGDLVIGVVVGLGLGLNFRDLGYDMEGYRMCMSFVALLFMALALLRQATYHLPLFSNKDLYRSESYRQMHTALRFAAAQAIADSFMQALQVTIIVCVSIAFTGIEGHKVGPLLALALLYDSAFTGILYFIGMACANITQVNIFATLTIAVMGLYSGLVLPLARLPSFLSWLRWLSAPYYANMLAVTIALNGREFDCGDDSQLPPAMCHWLNGNTYLGAFVLPGGADVETARWAYVLALLLMALVGRVAGAAALSWRVQQSSLQIGTKQTEVDAKMAKIDKEEAAEALALEKAATLVQHAWQRRATRLKQKDDAPSVKPAFDSPGSGSFAESITKSFVEVVTFNKEAFDAEARARLRMKRERFAAAAIEAALAPSKADGEEPSTKKARGKK